MTILFMDGFENYNVIGDMAGMWNAAGSPTFGIASRSGFGSGIQHNVEADFMSLPLGGDRVSGIIGFAFRKQLASTITDFFLRFNHPTAVTNSHLRLYVTTANNFQLRRVGGPILATSAKSFANNVWIYVECRWLIDDAVGEFELRVNGKSGGWINESGIDTLSSGTAAVDEILLEGSRNMSGRPFSYDDFYFLDLNGSAPGNDFLGDSIVETLNPSGTGAEAQWTPDAGSNFQMVDEATPDGDTTFNSSVNIGDDDRFQMDNLVNVPSTVFAVQVQGQFRLENSGARDVRLKAHDGVTEGQSGDFQPSFDTVYSFEKFMFEDHPTGAAPWSTAEVNAMEAGYRIEA